MSKRNLKYKKGTELDLVIEDIAFGGKGISKISTEEGDFIVFVPNTIPGQKVKAKVSKCKKNYAEAKLMTVLENSPDEVEVEYQIIPGAPYIQLPIEKQTELKKRTTFELFKRIAKEENIEDKFDKYIHSPALWHYRNKMEYSFSAIGYDLEKKTDIDEFSLGFKHRGTWWMVENLDKDSGIFDKQFEDLLIDIRKWCIQTELPAWHPPKKEGFFRYLVVRKSYFSNKLLISLVTSDTGIEKFNSDEFVELLTSQLGDRIEGILHTVNTQIGDRVEPNAGNTSLLFGNAKLIETIGDLEFEISMGSFFQTNPKCAELLYAQVVDYATESIEDDKLILDLFCGTGTIAQLLAKGTKNTVIGVDIVASAIDDAKLNAKRNKVSNVDFHVADVGKFLIKYPHYKNKISTVVLDPPRAGISPKALLKVIDLQADRMVYVSCNPATQARDTEILSNAGYTLTKITFADQFPHTSHVETIAVFEK